MKYLYDCRQGATIAVAVFGLIAALPGTGQADIADGRVAWYPFNGDASDASGNSNDATITGATPSTDRLNLTSSAYAFDGNDDKIQAPNSASLEMTDALSIAVWVRPIQQKSQQLVVKGTGLPAPYSFSLGGNNSVNFNVSPDGVFTQATWGGYALNKWTLYVGTWDGATMRVYENGVEVVTQAASGTLAQNGSPLLIGTRLQLPADTVSGDLDEVMIWNRALTADEVSFLTKTLVASYAFSGNANDDSGYENDGVVDGPVLTADRFGNANAAYAFDGDGDRIEAASSPELEITGALTFSAWVRPNSVRSQMVVAKGAKLPAPYRIALAGNGTVVATVATDGASPFVNRPGYAVKVWTHYAVTWDGSTLTLYENGIPVQSDGGSGVVVANGTPLLIGTRTGLPADTVDGDIDEVTVWHGALSEQEVVELMGEAPTPRETTSWGALKASFRD